MISNLTRKITIPHKCCCCRPVAVLPGRGRLLPCVPGGGGGGGGQRGEGGGELLQPGAVQLRQQRRDGAARPARVTVMVRIMVTWTPTWSSCRGRGRGWPGGRSCWCSGSGGRGMWGTCSQYSFSSFREYKIRLPDIYFSVKLVSGLFLFNAEV